MLAVYDMTAARSKLRRDRIAGRPAGLWRYRELLPVESSSRRLSLGEGGTPLMSCRPLGEHLGVSRLYIKDEGLNPTGSFKARGLAVAVSRAVELGSQAICLPTAGNAGVAAAAYAARAGIPCHVYAPRDTAPGILAATRAMGARVETVDGSIADAAAALAAQRREEWFDVSTMREPFRVEGKKTMGFEIVEQLDWKVPDVVVYPTGGGTGLVGVWKALDELDQLGWLADKGRRPRMIAVQASGCAPVVKAWESGATSVEPWSNPRTSAAGLRVPKPFADGAVLDILRKSKGAAIAVQEKSIHPMRLRAQSMTGISICPEGAAALAGLRILAAAGELNGDERVVVFNTGSGLLEPAA